jgi:hypothetical protein
MPVYYCENPKCFLKDLHQSFDKAIIKIQYGEVVDLTGTCKECRKPLVPFQTEGFTTHMAGSDNICKK